MPRPVPVVRHERAGSIDPVRVGVRWRADGEPVFGEARLVAGTVSVGPFRLRVGVDAGGEAARFDVELHNAGPAPVVVDAVVLGLRWRGPRPDTLRFLRHGWQSWSFTGARDLDAEGEPAFPSGPWLRGMMHARGVPPADRAGWHESDLVTAVATAGAACCVGVLERGREFGTVYLRGDADGVRLEVELDLERSFGPGEIRALERVRTALGTDAHALLEEHAAEHGRHAGARAAARFRSGWCTWYHFFHEVTADDVLRNLDVLTTERDAFPVDVVQIDDGYQRAVGDWLETSPRFPDGIAPLARAIRAAGFEAGLWTAPFCAVPGSRVVEEHPEWLLREGEAPFRGLLHPEWSKDASVFVLDASRDEVRAHLVRVFRELVDMGFSYQKLDFLYAQAMRAEAFDPGWTRAERLRRGLEAVREGCGEDAFLLGCGCPQGAAVGVVDSMRIGPDVAPAWGVEDRVEVPGLGPTRPSTFNALRNVLHRAWMHRRLWINDPDCLMARTRRTHLSRDEAQTLAAAIAVTGGLAILSDDLPLLDAEARELVRESFVLARQVDAGGREGTARADDFLREDTPCVVRSRRLAGEVVAAFNLGEGLRSVPLDERVDLAPHASAVLRIHEGASLAVFCDMDGTFIDRDVGATLAQVYAPDRRPAQWARYERGEITAWEYNLEILDGLPCPEDELDSFLRSIELDPGARDLLRWCGERGVPFRVLSDGFDRNLERIMEIQGVRFDFDANHLEYEGGVWRVREGFPNPGCPCGTGTCKAGRIDALRRKSPRSVVVHIGNGRVSDLCGALAADLVFAKDSLAVELRRLGVRYEPFETLRDVVAGLDRLWDA